MAHPVSEGLTASSSTEAPRGSPVRGRRASGRQLSQRQPPLHLLEDPHEEQAAHLPQMCREPRSSHRMLLGWWFSLWEPPHPRHGLRLVDSVGFIVVSLTPLAPSILSPHHFTRNPKLRLMFDCGLCICFHQLLDEASQETVMLGSYLQA